MSELSTQILDALRSQPGLKAIDLERALGVNRSVISAVLYKELKSQVRQDKSYRWYPVSVLSEEEAAIASSHPLARLCRYYLDCLSHDDLGGVSVFANSHGNTPHYLELPGLPGVPNPNGEIHPPANARQLLARANTAERRQTLIVGYPVRLKAIASKKSGWSGFKLEPLFLFTLQEQDGREDTSALSGEAPQVNFEALKSLVGVNDYGLMDEAIVLADQLGLSGLDGKRPDLDELFARLQSIRPEWDWRETIDPNALSSGQPIAALADQGIYNRAVLVSIERSPYTKGLESDLASLQTVSPEGCALGDWLSGEEFPGTVPDEKPLLEVLPLNTEQRQAVRQALTNPLTVITGPPGTGKSQVVTSILINAAWQGRTVLFASKNNKAVDVVETRVNGLTSRPVLIRLGSGEYQTRVAEYLTALLAATATESDHARLCELQGIHEQLIKEADGLEAELQSYIARRNEVDWAEQSVERVRTELGEELFQSARTVDLSALKTASGRLTLAIRYASKNGQSLLTSLLWPLLKARRYRALESDAAHFAAIATAIGLPMPTGAVGDATMPAWERYAERLGVHSARVAAAREYFDKLDALTAARSLEGISEARTDVTNRISDNSSALWDAWLRLAPARLTAPERQSLGDLSALMQMIVSANAERRTVRKEVFQRYYELFPKVSSTLPCWAVTSLSARGRIPFQAGFVDLLVIDEASQCDIASVVPLLYRARRVVVLGDPKQLKHISRLARPRDQQLLAKHDLLAEHPSWAYSTQSLFDLAVTRCRSTDIVVLKDHHRSHADIIGFSNQWFYESALRIATRHERLRRPSLSEPAVRWIDVQGRTVRPADGGALNEAEAQAVLTELRRLVSQGYKGSIGVISPFRAQATRIRDLVSQDDVLAAQLGNADFLVDTVHKFQGDERDVMLFSPAISDYAADSALQFLRSNANLFNVAITRARSSLVVIGDQRAAVTSDVDYLTRFANHCDTVKEGVSTATPATATDMGPDYPRLAKSDRVSEWERVFYRVAYAGGLQLIPQYPVEKYFLDFALIVGDRRLNIEIDGEHYHRDWNGELCRRDQIRNQRMIELGWDVMRFWVYQVRDDQARCLERVRRWVNG